MTAETLIHLLPRVKELGPGKWAASCPTAFHAHGDRSQGLSVSEGLDGKTLIHCHAGCEPRDVLDAVGLTWRDLFPPTTPEARAEWKRQSRERYLDKLRQERGVEQLILDLLASDQAAGREASDADLERVAQAEARTAEIDLELGTAPTGLEDCSPFSDLGNVHRLIEHFGGKLRYSDSGWLLWNGISWALVKLEAERLAHELGRIIRKEADLASDKRAKGARTSPRDDLLRFAGQSEGRKRIVDALELLKREVFVPTSQWNTHRHLLPVSNGVVDLKTGALLPPDPELRMIGCSPVAFDPEAACPRWLRFLNEVFPSSDLFNASDLPGFMQRLFGMCLTGETIEHVLPILWGVGRNGKSVLLSVLQHILGPFAVVLPADVLASKHMERDTQRDAVLLHGVRCAIASESEAGAKLKTAFVKLATGGDRLSGRRLYSEAFNFVPTHKMILVTNHKPKVPADDEAVWRRLSLVPFTRVFSEAEQDPGLTATLLAEAPGILAWAVRGAGDWYLTGLGRPRAVREATAEFRSDEDAVQEFLDTLIQQPGTSTALTAIYGRFREWSISQGTRSPMSSKAFSSRLMTLLGVSEWRRSNGARIVDGVRLPSEFD